MVGSTNDLEKRLHQHNNLKSGAHYTKIRRPVKLVYKEKFKQRLLMMQIAIDEAVSSYGRVIVCLSGNFVIRNPLLLENEYDIDGFLAYLKTKK